MHQSLLESVKASMVLLPLLRDDTAVASKFVDMLGFDYVDFLILVGDTDTTVDVKAQESVNADGSLPSDITGAAITQITALGDNVMVTISINRTTLTKRYVGLSFDPGNGINGANGAAIAIRYGLNGIAAPVAAESAGSNSYATSQSIKV